MSKSYIIILLIFITSLAFGDENTFVTINSIGTYVMGDNDTLAFAKEKALEDARKKALGKTRSFIESTVKTEGDSIVGEKYTALHSGIIKETIDSTETTIVNTRPVYIVNASFKIDTSILEKRIDSLSETSKIKSQMNNISQENIQLKKLIDDLVANAQLIKVQGETAKNRDKFTRLNAEAATLLRVKETGFDSKTLTVLTSNSLNKVERALDRKLETRLFLDEIMDVFAGNITVMAKDFKVFNKGERNYIEVPIIWSSDMNALKKPLETFFGKNAVSNDRVGLLIDTEKSNQRISSFSELEINGSNVAIKVDIVGIDRTYYLPIATYLTSGRRIYSDNNVKRYYRSSAKGTPKNVSFLTETPAKSGDYFYGNAGSNPIRIDNLTAPEILRIKEIKASVVTMSSKSLKEKLYNQRSS